jgi:hypothetical protein
MPRLPAAKNEVGDPIRGSRGLPKNFLAPYLKSGEGTAPRPPPTPRQSSLTSVQWRACRQPLDALELVRHDRGQELSSRAAVSRVTDVLPEGQTDPVAPTRLVLVTFMMEEAFSIMPDRETNQDLMRGPPCEQCGRVMRFIGTEPDANENTKRLHTFECECGEYLAVPARYS